MKIDSANRLIGELRFVTMHLLLLELQLGTNKDVIFRGAIAGLGQTNSLVDDGPSV
jgi:hypothetical protein